MNSHQRIDLRSLAFGRAIAARLEGHPEHLAYAQENLNRWRLTCSSGVQPALSEWLDILAGPLSGVVDVLTSSDERAIRLRQSNPFAGVLSSSERNSILRQFQSHDATPA